MRASIGLGVCVTVLGCAAVHPQAEQARAVGSKQMSCPEGEPEAKLVADHGDTTEWQVGCNFESVLVTCERGAGCALGKLVPHRVRAGGDLLL